MNYWERHIGDYIRDTVSLSMLEDGAYTRLLDQYYQNESPLPADKKEVYRLARATSTAERKAVDYVLQRYFELGADGFRQKRCDEVIEAFWDQAPALETKRANERERQRRSRERRATLFEALRAHGVVPPFKAKTHELEAELSRVTKRDESPSVTRDNTATQTPEANPQSPLPTQNPVGTTNAVGITPRDASADAPARASPAELSAAMRRHSISAQPADPRVIAAAEAGITVATIEAVCLHVKEKKPDENISSGYVLATAKGWIADASKPASAGGLGRRQTSQDARLAQSAANVASWLADEPAADDRTIDMPTA
ncbi:hypothetical protein PCA31118_04696 [Pandoraea captiosa]|uniref:DUF1376 domain-containing protein n=2 Tax=Pandoraea captiosa TaxID=2508302 RepID=A0A5E5AM71_9BURK|nr:YdaU family protein [Pandoraea captiosa]VVE74176.1 hypothetical protein PCA31118_04696 [Pandoraea captiosa]